ncbi:MAG: TfoX/Sxy family protein [Anaerolineales bacterium]|jgi:TfoX/Sxy family transcriptional regulator of competence genes
MGYDKVLADRIANQLSGNAGLTQREMFGGIAFMLHGNMVCGVIGAELIARVGIETSQELRAEPGVRDFDMNGRPMRGWLVVGAGSLDTDRDLGTWIDRALRFTNSLPPKSG